MFIVLYFFIIILTLLVAIFFFFFFNNNKDIRTAAYFNFFEQKQHICSIRLHQTIKRIVVVVAVVE